MKKQELIHLHCLGAEVKKYYEAEVGAPVECDAYAELGIKPTSIYKSKTRHKEGTLALLDSIATQIEAETDNCVSRPSD